MSVADGSSGVERGSDDLSAMLRCSGDGLIRIDARGAVVRMNSAAEALTGWREVERVGRSARELVR